jgi:hypothetical protein
LISVPKFFGSVHAPFSLFETYSNFITLF